MLIVRENSEGEYAVRALHQSGNTAETRFKSPCSPRSCGADLAICVYSRARIRLSVTSVSKANALNYSGVFWDRVLDEVQTTTPTCRVGDSSLTPRLAMVLDPTSFDIVVDPILRRHPV